MDDLVTRAAANCAGAYRQWAMRTGHPSALWPDVSVSDLGIGGANPIDSASPLTSFDPAGLHEAVDRVEAFFAARPGGPIQIWSAWRTPDLEPRGYRLHQVPGMLRQPGGVVAPVPPELEVSTARTGGDFADVAALIDEVFECRAADRSRLASQELLGDDWEVFIGRVGGRAVATATAYVSDGLCGVYAVATTERWRGRGYGEAVAWAATTFRPDLPGSLQASPMGRPIYQRMGYREITMFSLWQAPRPA